MLQPDRSRRRLTHHHQHLPEALARKGGAQLKRLHQVRETARKIVKRRLVAVREALNEARVAQEGLPAVVVITN